MGCTLARSVTFSVPAAAAAGRLDVLVDMGVKGGWWLTEGVTAGVPFNLQDIHRHAKLQLLTCKCCSQTSTSLCTMGTTGRQTTAGHTPEHTLERVCWLSASASDRAGPFAQGSALLTNRTANRACSTRTHSSEGDGVGPGVSSERVPPATATGVLVPCWRPAAAGVLGGCFAAAGVACWSGLLPAASDATAAASLPSPSCRISMFVMIMLGPLFRAFTA